MKFKIRIFIFKAEIAFKNLYSSQKIFFLNGRKVIFSIEIIREEKHEKKYFLCKNNINENNNDGMTGRLKGNQKKETKT